jgi:hypothetical protein
VNELWAGFSATCAQLSSSDAVYCWGSNEDKQFHSGGGANFTAPVNSVWDGYDNLAIGLSHICGQEVDTGAVACAGAGADGQLGNGANTDASTPVDVLGLPNPTDEPISKTSAGYFYSCALTNLAKFYCWGDNTSGQLGGTPGTGANTARLIKDYGSGGGGTNNPDINLLPITSGYAHSCAGLECIGENGSGQLGDGTNTNKTIMTKAKNADNTPVNPLDPNSQTSNLPSDFVPKQVQAGFDFTCWLAGEASNNNFDAVFCSGAGADGQLGNSANDDYNVPIAVDTTDVAREETYIELALADEITLPTITPGVINSSKGNLNANVVTNYAGGYIMQIHSQEDGTTGTSLVCKDNSSFAITAQTTPGDPLETNHWGFGTGDTEPTGWTGLKLYPDADDLASSATATTFLGDNTKLWFGVKADFALPACEYSGAVVVTVVPRVY